MSRNHAVLSFAMLVCAGVVSSPAMGPGDEVVVVFNTRVPESKSIAEYYAERRHVPPGQIFGFPLTTEEDMSRVEFREALQKPLALALLRKKLWRMGDVSITRSNSANHVERRVVWSKIRYAVLCYGVPLRIEPDENLKEEGSEKLRPEMRRNEAAVDSELAFLPFIENRTPLSGPLRNQVYGATNAASMHPTNGVLLVARLDGPSPAVARGLVDKALEAETDGVWGRAYFDVRNTTDHGLKLGDDWIRTAAEMCRRLGFETVVDENPGTFPAGYPMSHIAFYMGWYDADVSGPFAQPTVEFMPGAFAYHLHSFSAARIRTATRFWVGPLLAKGATATMGCVYEPYLVGTPDLGIFAARFLYSGFSFGEAAYASQSVLSWQTTVVGDPLFCPYKKNTDQFQEELLQRQSKLIEWFYLRLLNFNLANGKPVAASVSFLEELPTTKHSAVLSEKLGDLYAAQGKPSSAIHAYMQALELEPSRQQAIRLRLTLGERLIALDREAEAYEQYQKLLQDNPDYPDRAGICRRLIPLAQKLGKKDDLQKLESELNPPAPPASTETNSKSLK
jgi:uncharacterized protein (TIGR03790 family)